jgi:hypothetical protein
LVGWFIVYGEPPPKLRRGGRLTPGRPKKDDFFYVKRKYSKAGIPELILPSWMGLVFKSLNQAHPGRKRILTVCLFAELSKLFRN